MKTKAEIFAALNATKKPATKTPDKKPNRPSEKDQFAGLLANLKKKQAEKPD